ncbi:MAG: polyprenyl synthetase family protein [Clostridiales Family XIII bacterium]|jgi:geranylgeranyl diphosphate synthase type II|nr:polyprenyl synthetase family protein [Clostridiales Family XIII bacterium]
MSFETEAAEYRKLVDENIIGLIPEVDKKSNTLFEAMKYTLKGGGKRLRSILLLTTCDLVGGDEMQALPYACAVEYIHNYSLIHDDLPAIDNDDLRRGKASTHVVFGEAMAILAGDGLLNSAFEVMLRDMNFYFDKPDLLKRRIKAANEIAKCAGVRSMIAGQVADIEAEDKAVSPELLDYIHINKTAALIQASVLAGAYLGGANAETIENLSIYGENLGLAFQIADDILDVTGDESELGKHVGKDIAAKKATYPALHGLENSHERLNELTEIAAGAAERVGLNAEVLVEHARALAKRKK